MSNTPPEPKFKVGDLVRHRASGARAVVVELPSGTWVRPVYTLSTDLGAPDVKAYEIELEPVTPPEYEADKKQRLITELKEKLKK